MLTNLDENTVDMIYGLKKLGFDSQDIVMLDNFSNKLRRIGINECNRELSSYEEKMDKKYTQAAKVILTKYVQNNKITSFEIQSDPRGAMIIIYRDNQDNTGIRI